MAETAVSAGDPPGLLSGDTYPVGFWFPPPPEETTVERYAEIADAGFTFTMGGNGSQNLPANDAVLNAAAANDLQTIVIDTRISNIQNFPQDQWPSVIASTLQDYQSYPAFAGFMVRDEPSASVFPQIGSINDNLGTLAPSILGWANLFPNIANASQLGTATYQEYLDQYVSDSRPDFISFDHYPLLNPSGVESEYFHNWVKVRAEALASNLPSWGFVRSVQNATYRSPTASELLWNINTALAYGAKGIEYFTYWTPSGFTNGLVGQDGVLGPLYSTAQDINTNYLRPVGKKLLPLTSESVTFFAAPPLPSGVQAFTGDEWVAAATGHGVILSRFNNPADVSRRWLLVVNRWFDEAGDTTLTLGSKVTVVDEFDPATQQWISRSTGSLDVSLAAGEAKLYRFDS